VPLGSVRSERIIDASAADVWALVGRPERLHDWFPGVVSCSVEGNRREIHLESGLSLPEEITIHDDRLRRFQYRIDAPMFPYHRGTIDVIEVTPTSCAVIYATDCDPRTMALVIGAAAAAGLDRISDLFSSSE
jgi:hypothetical protein